MKKEIVRVYRRPKSKRDREREREKLNPLQEAAKMLPSLSFFFLA